jgi:TrmH family RNA methyltransferase
MLKATTNLKNVVVDNNKKWSLIFGNESTGLDDSFLKIGEPLIIKHTKNIDSLNVSVSVAIALFYFTDFKN